MTPTPATAEVLVVPAPAAARRRARGWWRRLTAVGDSTPATVGVAVILFWLTMAALAPVVAPYAPNATDLAPLAVLGATALGCLLGLAAGYKGGWIDLVVTRACDIVLSFPVIILYMIILTHFGSSAWNIIGVLTLTKAPIIARIVRGLTLDLREREYVTAAKMRGESSLYIMFVEILPNARGPLIVDMCLRTGYNIIIIGVLGFLGIGLPPPDPDRDDDGVAAHGARALRGDLLARGRLQPARGRAAGDRPA